MQKSILSVVGKDKVGIIGALCSYLAEENINILDISQTIVDGFFNMMLICDTNNSKKSFSEIADGIENLGKTLGVMAKIQREDIFTSMQRI
ncbi:MAG: ACT domain-containing protein [Spirochaetales bacterium]|nr:ACT domain-containing protein [Spirochaetales bacterium]